MGRESQQGITSPKHLILLKKLKYWNQFYGKEEERRGEERLKRKKRERESRKKVKTNPIPQKREREREREREKEGGMFHNRRGKASMKKPMGRREKKGKNK